MALTEHNNISIAQVVLYVPALAVAIFLCVKHGFGRSAGWLYLVIFSLSRILGASLQLATIADPGNLSLYFGSLTLQNIGISPLTLTLLALVNRVLASIENRSGSSGTIVNPRVLRLGQIVVLVGLILTSIGGSNSGTGYASTGVYAVSALTQAGLGLTIAGFALVVLATAVIVLGGHVSSVEDGEKRVVLAVALSAPFLLVRILYSAIGVYGYGANNNKSLSAFSPFAGDVNVLLGMAVIEEIIVVFVIEAVGLTLKVRPTSRVSEDGKEGSERKRRRGPISRAIASVFGKRRRRSNSGYEMARSNRGSDVSHV
ncbi:hypothetical protein F5Y17DRAFT_204816 [Xylariaceae sp. FL0594]|nr:hypothetical protein F5Y17DRAFT_204816 [Xylariaceae sp. FL0594]